MYKSNKQLSGSGAYQQEALNVYNKFMRTRLKRILRILLISLLGVLVAGLLLILALYIFLRIEMNRTNGQITSAGLTREYLIHVPESYDPATPTPLMFNIHGFAQWPANQADVSQWNELADEYGFIVVYPKGRQFPLRWYNGAQPGMQEDLQFFADMIDQFSVDYNIDPARIYASGLSNGAGMSFALACRLSDRIAAFGGVAGAYALSWEDCDPARPVPAIIFHGTADPIVSFTGMTDTRSGFTFPDITTWVQDLARRNGCETNPEEQPAQGSARGYLFGNCDDNADVHYYIIDGGGHTWPGGGVLPRFITGVTTQDIDATRLMYEFFMVHPLGK